MKRTLVLTVAAIGAILVAAIIFVIAARLLTPEDTWIKDSAGQWVKHGNPAATMPK